MTVGGSLFFLAPALQQTAVFDGKKWQFCSNSRQQFRFLSCSQEDNIRDIDRSCYVTLCELTPVLKEISFFPQNRMGYFLKLRCAREKEISISRCFH
jgi:hypothetical protein